MDIREFSTYRDDSPVSGSGIWIVLDESGGRAHLLHPYYLTELKVSEYDFLHFSGSVFWPENNSGLPFLASRFMDSFKRRIVFFLENERPIPVRPIAKALSELEEIPYEEAMSFIRENTPVSSDGVFSSLIANKENKVFALSKNVDLTRFFYRTREYALVKAFEEHGPSSISRITELVEGKLQTKCNLGRTVTYLCNRLASQGVLEITVLGGTKP